MDREVDQSVCFEGDLVHAVTDIVTLEIVPMTALEEVLVGLQPDFVTHGFGRRRLVDEADAEFVFGGAPEEDLTVDSATRILVYELLSCLRKFADNDVKALSGAVEFP